MSVWETREERLESFKTLEDGWFGPGTIAPKHFILEAIAEAFSQLDPDAITLWAFGPWDGGIAFEHRSTVLDDDLKAVVTRDTDVWVVPFGEDTYEVVVSVQESYFDDSVYTKNTQSTTKSNPHKLLREAESSFEGTVDNIVLALQRRLVTWN